MTNAGRAVYASLTNDHPRDGDANYTARGYGEDTITIFAHTYAGARDPRRGLSDHGTHARRPHLGARRAQATRTRTSPSMAGAARSSRLSRRSRASSRCATVGARMASSVRDLSHTPPARPPLRLRRCPAGGLAALRAAAPVQVFPDGRAQLGHVGLDRGGAPAPRARAGNSAQRLMSDGRRRRRSATLSSRWPPRRAALPSGACTRLCLRGP
jgi:hypothetical protein